MRGTYLAATAAALWASLATYPAQAATVIATCGPSKGTAYFFPSPQMKGPDTGWHDDGIDGGAVSLVMLADKPGAIEDKPDLIFKDSYGTRSAIQDGAIVSILAANTLNRIVIVQAFYSGSETVEVYTFRIGPDKRGEVLWSAARAGGTFQKSALMRAECSFS
ncbi:hypothetical protein [Nitrospirillum sp. BR 11163]|uniref:hypothetical protein n=1 Tax=Nitrospirillum sp. BR 11163 TaxID=3104323 RepID=UPI002AFDEA98|nr:hypothetical protein [Nitrospirillum sp. BR 11163]MEA1675248.1 hypothetical protein [Nitrospirillum sp. BR 11163]